MRNPAEPGSETLSPTSFAPPVGSAAHPGPSLLIADLPPAGEFTRLSLWMAGSLAGVATPTHAALGRHCRAMAKRLGWRVRGARSQRPSRADAMVLFAEAVVGTRRAAIASVFGPPRCAVMADGSVATPEAAWLGQTWYYPVTSPSAVAVAIEFADEHACRIVFVGLGVA